MTPPHAPIRILVVEDEFILSEDIKDTLVRKNFEVIGQAVSAHEACELAQHLRPDLVMMDIQLQGEDDGIIAATTIRNRDHIPVVFLTAHTDPATLERAKHAAPYGYLVKPFSDKELEAAVEMAIFRHKADRQVQSMELWLRTTLSSIGDGVIALDPSRRITFINPIAEKLTGWDQHEAIGQPCEEIFKITKNTDTAIANPITATLNPFEPVIHEGEYTLTNRFGQEIRISNTSSPIRDAENKLIGAVLVFKDCTENHRIKQAARDLEHKLQEAKRLKSIELMAGGIAHDFNNLLAIILGNAELLAMGVPLPTGLPHPAEQIKQASLRAGHLCEQLLAYLGNIPMQMDTIDLNKLAHETRQLVLPLLDPNIDLRIELASEDPLIQGDHKNLQSALRNLLINSAESMSNASGVIRLRTFHAEKLPAKVLIPPPTFSNVTAWICLEVSDTGCGIKASLLDQIFDPFFTTKFTGRGLGLSVVRGMAYAHKAAVAVTSEVHIGTTFQIYLPVAPKETTASSVSPPPIPQNITGRIVIVDDEEHVVNAISTLLIDHGHSVEAFTDPTKSLRYIKENALNISILIVDLTMPKITGSELINEIKKIKPALPIIVISGYSETVVRESVKFDSRMHFLAKPFPFPLLRDSIAELISK